jgi:hypothetical protein
MKPTPKSDLNATARAIAARLAAAAGLVVACVANAAPVDSTFTYRGELSSGGVPAAGAHDIRFRLYDSLAGGVQVGPTLCMDNALLVNGRFTVALDFGMVFDGTQHYLEVEVRPDTGLDCTDATGMTTLEPRQVLLATPNAAFAINAANAVQAASATTAGSATTASTADNAVLFNGQSATFYQDAANLTGTVPATGLAGAYSGALTFSNAANLYSGNGAALTALNASNLTTGTLPNAQLSGGYTGALAFSNAANVYSGNGAALTALNASNLATGTLPNARLSGGYTAALTFSNPANVYSGNGAALTALDASNISTGIIADARLSPNVVMRNEPNAFGDFINSFAGNVGIGTTNPVYPINFSNTLGDKISLFGTAADHYGFGIQSNQLQIHTNNSSSDIVFGHGNSAAMTETVRIQGDGRVGIGTSTPDNSMLHAFTTTRLSSGTFETDLAGGVGVWGIANGTTLDTVAGAFISQSNAGTGVYAIAEANTGVTYGVRAYTDSSATNAVGVFGQALRSGANFGVYGQAAGASSFGVYANGRLGASGTKSFMIDHPLDPENKFLMHYSMESPEVLNVYSGTAPLDASGEAWITLPDYFSSINIDPRYLLTSIGGPAPMLHVATEIEGNQFRIAGGMPNGKVSWEVKAKRNDRFVEVYGAPVERPKVEGEKGTYLRPELYGQPDSKSQLHTTPRARVLQPANDTLAASPK